jgi:hypothetical protein
MCPAQVSEARPSGHLQVKGPKGRRAWYALWRDAEGRHQRALGRACVKPCTRHTERGAIMWRAGDGPKPGSTGLRAFRAVHR